MYVEVLLRVLLKRLSCAQESFGQERNSSVSIPLNSDTDRTEKNIIEFNSPERRLILNQVSNQELSKFLNQNIEEIRSTTLISCCYQSYMFRDKNNTPKQKAKKAATRINQILDGEETIGRDEIGCIFTELYNAEILKNKKERFYSFYSSIINVDLENLNENSVQKYIQKICGAGGKLDSYLYLKREHQRNRLELNSKSIEMMRSWSLDIFDCSIEDWKNKHWDIFEKKWNTKYPHLYCPKREDVTSILIANIDTGKFDPILCIYLYNFLKSI